MRLQEIVLAALISTLFCFYCSSSFSQEDGGLTESMVGLDSVTSSQDKMSSLSTLIKDGFSYNLRGLLFINAQFPGHSTQNPQNAFLDLYRYSSELHLRPDLFLDTPLVRGFFKPRMVVDYQWWEDGITKGNTDAKNRAFINEWMVQLKPHSSVFLSFGKEKLLWGPSFLVSPSNILFQDVEKMNPKIEIRGEISGQVDIFAKQNPDTYSHI